MPLSLASNPDRPQVWKAYKRILRYARGRGLRKGDRLPSHPELGKALGLCGSTFRAAMEALEADGAVVGRQKVGTTIVDDELIARVPWTVGVATVGVDHHPLGFSAELFLRVLAVLSRAGCRCVVYQQRMRQSLGRFGGLDDDLTQGNVDGLVTLTPIDPDTSETASRQNVPICHTHWWKEATCGVLVDQTAWVEQAVALLAGRGYRRIAATDIFASPSYPIFWDGFVRALKLAGLPVPDNDLVFRKDYDRHVQLRRAAPYLAQLLLQLPAQERPDALIVADDYVAAHLALILRERSDYRPMLAVQTNRQIARVFSLPILAFEVDIEALAQQAVDLLTDRLCNPAAPERIEWYAPTLARPEEQLSPLSLAG